MKTHSKLALTGLIATALSGCIEADFERGFVVEKPQQVEIENYSKEPSLTYEDQFLNLGWLLEKKEGEIPSDLSSEEREAYIKQGIKLYEAHASSLETDEESKAKACGNLSVYYINKRDYKSAIKWAFLGVEKGSNRSAESLYICYLLGIGVVQDFSEAYKWKYIAAALGNENCQSSLFEDTKKSVNNPTFEKKLEEARSRAKEWEFNHPKVFFYSRLFDGSS